MLSKVLPLLVTVLPLLIGCATPTVVFDQQLCREIIAQDLRCRIPVSVAVFPATSNDISRVYDSSAVPHVLDRMAVAIDMLSKDLESTKLFHDVRVRDVESDIRIIAFQCQGAVRSGTPFLFGSRIMTLFMGRAESSYVFLYDFVIRVPGSDEDIRFMRKYRGMYEKGGISFPWAGRQPLTHRVDLLRHDLRRALGVMESFTINKADDDGSE